MRTASVLALLLAVAATSVRASQPLAEINGETIRTDHPIARFPGGATPPPRRGDEAGVDKVMDDHPITDKRLIRLVRTPLIMAYARRVGVEPTDEEIAPLLDALATAARDPEGDEEPSEERRAMRRKMAEGYFRALVRDIKVADTLWREHGGTLGLGNQGGCVALEAEKEFFLAEVEAGRLRFLDADLEARFWNAIADKRRRADTVIEDPERIKNWFDSATKRFSTPQP